MDRLVAHVTDRRVTGYLAALLVGLWVPYLLTFTGLGVAPAEGNRVAGDFGFFYVIGTMAQRGRLLDLYSEPAILSLGRELLPDLGDLHYPSAYPPQIALLLSPFAALPYTWAVAAWLSVTTAIYALSCCAVWRACPRLIAHAGAVALAVAAYPAFFYLVAFGQSSAPALACVAIAWLALANDRPWIAGAAIGALAYKPQLAIGFAIVFLVSREWRIVGGALASAAIEVGVTWWSVGTELMQRYAHNMLDVETVVQHLEPRLYHLHSLRGFFSILFPWPGAALIAYLVSSVVFLAIAIRCWRGDAPLAVRFSVVLLATVLVDPHLNVYDLVILAPMFLLVADWLLGRPADAIDGALVLLLIAAFALPLVGPIAMFTHVQLSVIAFWLLGMRLASTRVARAHVG